MIIMIKYYLLNGHGQWCNVACKHFIVNIQISETFPIRVKFEFCFYCHNFHKYFQFQMKLYILLTSHVQTIESWYSMAWRHIIANLVVEEIIIPLVQMCVVTHFLNQLFNYMENLPKKNERQIIQESNYKRLA